MYDHLGVKPIPPWSSLDGLPRIGGLCIEYGHSSSKSSRIVNQEMKNQNILRYEILSPRDSPTERAVSHSEHVERAEVEDHNEDKEVHQEEHDFGFENHYQYLAPDLQGTEKNPSEVSGSSSDSGYHGNNHSRPRKTGLFTVAHCKCNAILLLFCVSIYLTISFILIVLRK